MGLVQDPYNPVGTNPYAGPRQVFDESPAGALDTSQTREAGTVPAFGGGVLSGKTLNDLSTALTAPAWPGSLTMNPLIGDQPQNPAGPDLSRLH